MKGFLQLWGSNRETNAIKIIDQNADSHEGTDLPPPISLPCPISPHARQLNSPVRRCETSRLLARDDSRAIDGIENLGCVGGGHKDRSGRSVRLDWVVG